MLARAIKSAAAEFGFDIRRNRPRRAERNIPNADLYRAVYSPPVYSPWLGDDAFMKYFKIAEPRTIVSADRCYILYSVLSQAIHIPGDIWECGVYRGGTAAMMASYLWEHCADKQLYLFDTFEGMPPTDAERDIHKEGDFAETSVDSVISYIGHEQSCVIRKGLIPDSFIGLESSKIAFAHIDVDIYKSILDCLDFIWPRLSLGGFLVFDDYGFASCPGARASVDEFFAGSKCTPLCLQTGQALVFKSLQ